MKRLLEISCLGSILLVVTSYKEENNSSGVQEGRIWMV